MRSISPNYTSTFLELNILLSPLWCILTGKARLLPQLFFLVGQDKPSTESDDSQDNGSNNKNPELSGYSEFISCAIVKLEQVHTENRLLDDSRIRPNHTK